MSKKKTLSKTNPRKASKSAFAPYNAIVFPALWGVGALFLCVMVFSYFLTMTADPDKFIPYLCIVSVAVAGTVCGIICKKICGRKSALSVVAGLLIIGILLVVSLFTQDVCESSAVYKSAIVLLCPVTSFTACSFGKAKKKRTR